MIREFSYKGEYCVFLMQYLIFCLVLVMFKPATWLASLHFLRMMLYFELVCKDRLFISFPHFIVPPALNVDVNNISLRGCINNIFSWTSTPFWIFQQVNKCCTPSSKVCWSYSLKRSRIGTLEHR